MPISISLSREQKRWLDDRKASGQFTNRSAAVQHLIRQAMAAEQAAEAEASTRQAKKKRS